MIIEKVCTKCNTKKSFAEFSKRSDKKDGLQSWCKVCLKEYRQTETGRENGRRYDRSEKGRVSSKKYNQSEKGKATRQKGGVKYTKKNPHKKKAKKAVNHAVERGKFSRVTTQTCADCGKQAEHYHHESYAKKDWLNVIPLCVGCHNKRHQSG